MNVVVYHIQQRCAENCRHIAQQRCTVMPQAILINNGISRESHQRCNVSLQADASSARGLRGETRSRDLCRLLGIFRMDPDPVPMRLRLLGFFPWGRETVLTVVVVSRYYWLLMWTLWENGQRELERDAHSDENEAAAARIWWCQTDITELSFRTPCLASLFTSSSSLRDSFFFSLCSRIFASFSTIHDLQFPAPVSVFALRHSFQSGTPVYVCVLVRPSLALVHSLPLSATFRLLVEEEMERARIAPARTGRTQTGSGGPSKRPAFAWTGELSPHCRQTLMESMRGNEETNEDTSVWSREASELPIGPLKRPAIVCASKVSTWWLFSKSLKKHAGFDVEWMRGLQ